PTSEKEIKLGYFAKQAGIYTIDIDNMERFDGYSIVLVDKEMNITVNLLETDYSFTTASGEFDERFSLFISAKSSSVEEANQEVKIYSSENLIYLNIPQDENYCISVYDMLGKKVYSSIPSSIGFQSIDLGLKTGFYLVKVKNETSEYTEKVFLK
ncbi:MAG: T9SS type A sorting domain-containing protein, partial [Bacteroidetes bacterium]|nr:T9SS type A sorting domain-containing protein [Bacteroidota bacterium]